MNKKLFLVAVFILAASILAIIGFFVLPDVLVVQITVSGGAGNTAPKIVGIAIPFLITVVAALMYYFSNSKRYLIYATLGILGAVFNFVVNLVLA